MVPADFLWGRIDFGSLVPAADHEQMTSFQLSIQWQCFAWAHLSQLWNPRAMEQWRGWPSRLAPFLSE
eukprot:3659642-Lingulodinium_polyedra.AAC.1